MLNSHQESNSLQQQELQENISLNQLKKSKFFKLYQVQSVPKQSFYDGITKNHIFLFTLTLIIILGSMALLYQASHIQKMQTIDITKNEKQVNLLMVNKNKQIQQPSNSLNLISKQNQKQSLLNDQIQKAIKLIQAIPNIKSKQQKKQQKAKQILEQNKNKLYTKYNIEKYLSKELAFCIVFPSLYQNQNGQYNKILSSIVQQNYQNYKIVYVNKQSTTDLIHTTSSYLKSHTKLFTKSKLISKSTQNDLNNIYYGIQQHCKSGQIVLIISKATQFVGPNILSLYSAFFQQNKNLLTYSNYLKIDYETMKAELPSVKEIMKIVKSSQSLKDLSSFEQFPMLAFYTDLFSAIPIQNFNNQHNKFYAASGDIALYRSLLQLAGQKAQYLQQITYTVNTSSVAGQTQTKNNLEFLEQFQSIKRQKILRQFDDSQLNKRIQERIQQKPANADSISKETNKDQQTQEAEGSQQKSQLNKKKQLQRAIQRKKNQKDQQGTKNFKSSPPQKRTEQVLNKKKQLQRAIQRKKKQKDQQGTKNFKSSPPQKRTEQVSLEKELQHISKQNKKQHKLVNQQKQIQRDQIQILKNQDQLNEAILKQQSPDDRKILKQPTIVKKQTISIQKLKNQGQKLKQFIINQNQHKPKNLKPVNQFKQTKQVIINGNKGVKSTEVLPVDQLGGFIEDQQPIQTEIHKKIKKQNNKKFDPNVKKIFIAGRQDVKGPNYIFAQSIQTMVQKTDLDVVFDHKKSIDGIWRNQFLQAIKKLQITNNVKYGGQVQIQMTKHDNDKFQKTKRINDLIKEQTQYYEGFYKIGQFKKKQLPFCIVVPSYQNVKSGLYLRNLNSIFMQSYSNYHVVYIEDASQDKTSQYVKSYVLSRQIPSQKIQIITNKENRKPPFNIYNAITNHCKLGQLAMIIEGDDALIGTNVLSLYNAIYQKQKSAMIYSSYLDIYNNSKAQLGVGRQIMDQYFQKNSIRSIWQIPGRYLLSFYVDIFKSIKVDQFKDPKGYFFWFAYDRALITPLLQVSYPRISIVKEILYQHRHDTGKGESPNDWNRQSGQILAKKPYKPLKFFPFIQRNKYKYFFDVPVQKIIQNSDFSTYNFDNNFQSQGITKDMHIRAIKMTQIIHNVNIEGNIVVELAQYDGLRKQKQQRIQKLLDMDFQYYNSKYDIKLYKKDQLPMCIVVPSYNNVKSGLYLRNLDSMFFQDYQNYHIVYVDDCSPDKTGQFVKKYLQQKKIPKQKIQVIINKVNRKALYNIHLAIHQHCKSGQIVMMIDGDDSFIGRNILSLYNAVYQRDNAAMAYSNFLTVHNNDRTELGFCHEINKQMFEQNIFRNSWDLPGTHLMSFYADLFKRIKISDLTYTNGTFYDYAYDRAVLTPLLQMAYPRISVIKQIPYEYRNDTGINDSPDDWIRVSHIILDKKPYSHLQDYPFIQGLVVSTDKFNFMTSIQSVIKKSDFSMYQKIPNKKISGIAKEQHIHAIRLTELVHNINFLGKVKVSFKSTKNPQKKKLRLQKLLRSDDQYIQAKYQISKYKQKQLPFCIVVSAYNNIRNGLYLRNLDSIFMQNYQNYKVIYIDDNSPDQAIQYIQKYINQKQIPSYVIKVIINRQMRKHLANIYLAAHKQCNLDDIMLIVDGNDALIGRNVLSVLNSLYQAKKAQIGYGCFLKVYNQSTQLGSCDDIEEFYFKTNTFRNRLTFEKYKLMSFYTRLFRMIKIKDLSYQNGTFFNVAIDKAIMTPLIQMAYPNILIAKQIMYEYRWDQITVENMDEITATNLVLTKKPYDKSNVVYY